jgi:hypothetical protein
MNFEVPPQSCFQLDGAKRTIFSTFLIKNVLFFNKICLNDNRKKY